MRRKLNMRCDPSNVGLQRSLGRIPLYVTFGGLRLFVFSRSGKEIPARSSAGRLMCSAARFMEHESIKTTASERTERFCSGGGLNQ